ncbi:MAG: cohesin domain-containing protein, partial [Clostridia bacterium]|nr:cohesin domain-containing protein [Clostridia bacterium]
MRRLISFLCVLVMMLNILPIGVFAATESSTTILLVSVEQKWAKYGQNVEVKVNVDGNPGILGATFTLSWAEDLELVSAKSGDAFDELNYQKPSSFDRTGTNFIWYGDSVSEVLDGTILNLTFSVAENAVVDKNLAINISAKQVIDTNKNNIQANCVNGGVLVIDYTPGDTNNDNLIDLLDVISLVQYVSDDCMTKPDGFNISLTESASDVNDDGSMDILDVILISQYISDDCTTNPNGYNVTLVPCTPKCTHKGIEKVKNANDATCTEPGNIAYWYCSLCGKYFSDANGTTEITHASTVIPEKGHTEVIDAAVPPTYTSTGLTEGSHCSVCGITIIEQIITGPLTKDTYEIQYEYKMIPQNMESLKLKDTYEPAKGKVLAKPILDKYTFLGWSDKNGTFYGNELPVGITGDLILYANWASQRNLAVPAKTIGDPIICEDSDNGKILFVYEIGSIKNIPIFEKYNILSANGVITKGTRKEQTSIIKTDAEKISKNITNITSNSTAWTFSEDWEDRITISEEWMKENEMELKEAKEFCKTDNNTYNLINSEGGSLNSIVVNNSAFRINQNEAHSESTYSDTQKY